MPCGIVAMLLEWRNGREQTSWASVRRQLSYDVTLTSRDADHSHAILGIHIAHLAYIKAIHPETSYSKVLFPGRQPLRWPTHGDE